MDIILNKLRDIELRYRELEGLLSDPQVVSKQGQYQKYAKEHSDPDRAGGSHSPLRSP